MTPPKKVLVTGATGQIGYMIYKRLEEQPEKYDVYALDYKREPSARVPGSWTLEIPDKRFICCDISDFDQVRQAVESMDVVAHLAADPSGESWESLLNSNLVGTYNIFEACKVAEVGRIVAASSITVSQGHREQEPCDRPPAKAWGLPQKLCESICGFQNPTGGFNGGADNLAKQNNRSYVS